MRAEPFEAVEIDLDRPFDDAAKEKQGGRCAPERVRE
jgi:hypothetical protein